MTAPAADPGPPLAARRLVGWALALLVVPGLVGFDAWPLTAWRLFSLARGDHQTQWVIEAVAEDGSTRTVSLEELPLRYRHAAWPLAELRGAPAARREAVCQALLGGAGQVVPALVELRIVRDEQRLVEVEGTWEVTHDPTVVDSCAAEAAR